MDGKQLKQILKSWFGEIFFIRKVGISHRISMKDKPSIPAILQKIFLPNNPEKSNRKTFQKTELDWSSTISKIRTYGQKEVENWRTEIKLNSGEFIYISDIHFSHLSELFGGQAVYLKDSDLLPDGTWKLKNEIYAKDGAITYDRAEALMRYEGKVDEVESKVVENPKEVEADIWVQMHTWTKCLIGFQFLLFCSLRIIFTFWIVFGEHLQIF
jgi:hypothetical protein